MKYSKSIALAGLVIGGIGLNPIATLPGLAQPVVQTSEPRPSEADRLSAQGLKHYDNNQYAVALDSWQQSLALYQAIKDRRREGEILRNIGRAYYMLKDDPKATSFFEQSLAIAREVKNRPIEGLSLRNLGVIYSERNQPKKAIEYYEQALKVFQEIGNLGEGSLVSSSLGVIYFNLKNYPKSLEFHQKNLAVNLQLKNQANIANSFRNIGLAYEAQKDFPQAVVAFEKSLVIRKERKEKEYITDLSLTLGRLSQKLNQYPQAIAYFEQYLIGARDRPSFKEEALILKVIGDIYRTQPKSKENSEQAIKYYTDSLRVAEKKGNSSDVNHAFHGLGVVYMLDNRFSLAVEYLNKAISGWRTLKNQTMEANGLVLLGSLYAGAFEEDGRSMCARGLGHLEKSLIMLRQLNDRAVEAEVLGTLGNCYEERKDYQKAIESKNLSLEIARQTKNTRQEGIILASLGKSYQFVGNLPQARKYGEQGLMLLREVQDRQWEVSALDNLANIYVASGEPKKAIEAQMQKIAIAQKYGIKLIERGFNAVSINVEQAKKFNIKESNKRKYNEYRQKLEERGFSPNALNLSESNISDFTFYIRDAFMSLGDAYVKKGDLSQALVLYQAALDSDVAKGYSSSFSDVELLGKLGRTLSQLGRPSDAESMLKLALKNGEMFRTTLGYLPNSSSSKTWTDTDRIKFAERQAEDYRQLQQVLVRQNRTDEALEIAEEARARTFVELLSARVSGRPLGKDLPSAPNLSAIRQIAKDQKATLVEYSLVGPNTLYIWVIKPTGELIFRTTTLDLAQPIANLISDSRAEMGLRSSIEVILVKTPESSGSEPNDSSQQNLAKLHEILIAPIAQDLPTDPNQRVIFLPQGELFFVPFAALPDAQGKYLIEHHTISIAPSIQTLAFTHTQSKQAQSKDRSIVVGDPTMPIYDGTQLPPLPGARQEAIAIAKILNTSPLLGEQATKSAVLAQIQSASVIHFATHGLLDTIKGEIPGVIALAPSGQDNGLLSASELFDLKLTAHLVVLSACDTGRGNITGDGVVGLSRSLIAAGVPSVVVSLWAVNDKSTSLLMSDFYRNLKTNSSKAQAIRQAMLTTMKTYPNPRDWAAFTLVGESDR